MAPGKGEDEGRHYTDKQTRYPLVRKHGNALRRWHSPFVSLQEYSIPPRDYETKPIGGGPAGFACGAELDSFPVRHRPVAQQGPPRRVRADGSSGSSFTARGKVVGAVVAILASAGLKTDYHSRIARGW